MDVDSSSLFPGSLSPDDSERLECLVEVGAINVPLLYETWNVLVAVIVTVRSDENAVLKRVLLLRVAVEMIEWELLAELLVWLLSAEAELGGLEEPDLLELDGALLDTVKAGTVKVPRLLSVTATAVVGTAI